MRVHLRQPGEEAKLIELLGQSARFKMLNGKPQEAAKDFEVSQLVHWCIHRMPISLIYPLINAHEVSSLTYTLI